MKVPSIGPSRFVLFAGLLLGLAFVALTPPFQVPDEPAHFFRAVKISEGTLSTEVSGGNRGAWLPTEVIAAARDTTEGTIRTGRKPDLSSAWRWRFGASESRQFLRIPQPGELAPLAYTGAQYTPAPYLAAVLAVTIVRAAELPVLASLYTGRIFNLLLALAIVTLAVARMPWLRWTTALLALTPMAIFMRSSLSPDGLATALSFLFIAEVARAAASEGPLTWKAAVPLSALLLLIGVTKPNVLLVILLFMVPGRKFPRRADRMTFLLLPAIAAGIGLVVSAAASDVGPAVGEHAGRQLAALAADPLLALRALGNTWLNYLPRYLSEFVGKLGWLEVYLPAGVIVTWYAAALYLVSADGATGSGLSRGQRVVSLATFLACSFAVLAMTYLTWSSIGSTVVDGAQGRYFLPFAPTLAIALGARRWSDSWVPPVTAAAVLVSAGASVMALIARYW